MNLNKETVKRAIECVLDEYQGLEIDDSVVEALIEGISNLDWAKYVEDISDESE